MLLETPWLDSLETAARPARAKMLDLLRLPQPRVAATAPKAKASEDLTYKELVGEMGY